MVAYGIQGKATANALQGQAVGRDGTAAGVCHRAGAVEHQHVGPHIQRPSQLDPVGGIDQVKVVVDGQRAYGDLAGAVAAAHGDTAETVLELAPFGRTDL